MVLTDQGGQALILVSLTMLVVLGMAAVSIDVAQWYQRHHQAQVAADAAALAAANCLANWSMTSTSPATCTSINDPTATSVGTGIATDNRAPSPSISVGFDSVTVSVSGSAPAWFARLDNVRQATSTATATASFYPNGERFSCPTSGLSSCISFFAANPTCPSSATNTSTGLVLVTNDSGGGSSLIPDAYSNGYVFDGANAASSEVGVGLPGVNGAPVCATADTAAKGETVTYGSGTVPYPASWPMPWLPNCTRTASYFSSQSGTPAANLITTPGIYCVTSDGTIPTTAGTSCQSTPAAGATGYIYLDEAAPSLTPGGSYEFVSPCTTVADSAAPTITNVPGQPLVYGTANIVTPGTATSLPTCTSAANAGTAGSDLYILGNNASIAAPLYDQCGTVNVNQNNALLGYVAAWNIILQQNNTVNGDGPTTATGGGISPLPATDSLAG